MNTGLSAGRIALRLGMAALCLAACRPAMAADLFGNVGREVGHCFSGGCDVVWQLNRRIDDGVQSKADSLAEPFKQAFIDAVHQVFSRDLDPLVDKLDLLGTRYVAEATQLAGQVTADVSSIIDHAGAQVAADIVVFRQQVLDVTTREVRALVADVGARVDKFMADVKCLADGAQQGAALWLRDQVTIFGSQDACWAEHGARWFAPRSDNYIDIFRIHECELRREMNKSQTVRELLDGYGKLGAWARYMRCASGDDDAGARPFREVEAESNGAYDLWSFVSDPQFRSSSAVPQ